MRKNVTQNIYVLNIYWCYNDFNRSRCHKVMILAEIINGNVLKIEESGEGKITDKDVWASNRGKQGGEEL